MAAKVATAIRKQQATERIRVSCGVLGKRFGVKPDELFPRHKQPDIEQALQLEAIASFMEAIQDKPVKASPRKRTTK